MKKLSLLVLAFLISYVVTAQDIPFTMQKSKIFKDEYKNSTIVLVEDDGQGGVIVIRSYQGSIFSGGYGYYFEHYGPDMTLIKESEYEMKFSEAIKLSSVLGIILNDDEIHIIDFMYNTDQKAFVCSSNTANISDFKFSKKELFTLKSEEVKHFQYFNLFTSGGFDNDSGASMIVNEDRTAFAVTVDINDKKAETHKVYLFDNDLVKKIDHTFKREVKDKKFRYENIDVSKDGNALYLLGKVYTDQKKKKKEGGKYQYELTRITKDSEKTQVFDTEEHFSGSLKTIVFEDRVACIGFYSDKKDRRYKGISYFEMDPVTLAIRTTKYNPFTEQFIIDKYGKEKDKELKNLSFKKLFVTKNGDIVFNAEEFYITTHHMSGPNSMGTTYYRYHFDDIVSAKVNSSGDMVWARNINKRQVTGGEDAFVSYSSTVKDNDTYFFINTGDKIKKLRNDRIQFGQKSPNKSNLNVIRIKENGDFDYQEILDDKDNEVPFMVSEGAWTQSAMYFMGRKGKKKQLLKVTL